MSYQQLAYINPKKIKCKAICDSVGIGYNSRFKDNTNLKKCYTCERAFLTDSFRCPCCNHVLRANSKNKSLKTKKVHRY